MKSTSGRLKCLAIGLYGVLVVAGIAGAADSSPGSPSPASKPPNAQADLASGKARRLPDSPSDWAYGSVWRNCGFVIVKTHNTRYTDGGVEVAVVDSPPGDVAAQLPPVDPACAGVTPTAAQIADSRAQLQALSESARPKSATAGPEGGPPPPPLTIPPRN